MQGVLRKSGVGAQRGSATALDLVVRVPILKYIAFHVISAYLNARVAVRKKVTFVAL